MKRFTTFFKDPTPPLLAMIAATATAGAVLITPEYNWLNFEHTLYLAFALPMLVLVATALAPIATWFVVWLTAPLFFSLLFVMPIEAKPFSGGLMLLAPAMMANLLVALVLYFSIVQRQQLTRVRVLSGLLIGFTGTLILMSPFLLYALFTWSWDDDAGGMLVAMLILSPVYGIGLAIHYTEKNETKCATCGATNKAAHHNFSQLDCRKCGFRVETKGALTDRLKFSFKKFSMSTLYSFAAGALIGVVATALLTVFAPSRPEMTEDDLWFSSLGTGLGIGAWYGLFAGIVAWLAYFFIGRRRRKPAKPRTLLDRYIAPIASVVATLLVIALFQLADPHAIFKMYE